MENILYSIWLSAAAGAGSRAAVSLLREFGSAEEIYRADENAIRERFPSEADRVWKHIADKRLDRAEEALAFAEKFHVTVLTSADPRYPKSLLTLRDYPVVLFAVGELPDFDRIFPVAVVGTRKMSPYGKEAAYKLGGGLAAGGATVVSGLALGCDGMAMAGAIEAGGKTIGVIGCGIDIAYPPEHRDLMRSVAKDGVILTEYLPGTPPAGVNFPKRNRIISGLCPATVVVEADEKSGALITARHALYQGRDLYAVPGRIDDEGAVGTNRLLRDGAETITSAADLLRRYEFLYPHIINLSSLRRSEHPGALTAEETAGKLHVSARGDKRFYGQNVYGGEKKPHGVKKPENEPIQAAPASEKLKRTSPAGGKRISTLVENEKIPPVTVDYDMLGDTERVVLGRMTPDVPVLAEELEGKGLDLSAVLGALTVLEIAGAVEAGAGGYFIKRSGDGFDPAENETNE